jgi:hypothetical protein
MIACIINLSSLTYDNSLFYASSVLSIILLAILSLALALETYVIYKHRGIYHLEDFKTSYGASIEGLNTDTFFGRYWNPLTLIRWTITSVILIFLRDHCAVQIFVLLVMSVIFQILLLSAKPMTNKCDQRMAVMIEASVSIYLYTLLSLTDFTGENTLRVDLGWVLAMLIIGVIGINVILFIWKILSRALMFIKLVITRLFVK